MEDNKSVGGILVVAFVVLMTIMGSGGDSSNTSDGEINDIIAAKEVVKGRLNYPVTAQFHNMYTDVTPTHVHLKVTAKNGFGVPSTHTFSIPRRDL